MTAHRHDAGQAVVETAVALPILVTILLGVAQVAVVAVHQVAVINAARSGARAASVAAEPTAAATNVVARVLPSAVCTTTREGDRVTVEVTLIDPTDVSLIGILLPPLDLVGRATMLLEPPP